MADSDALDLSFVRPKENKGTISVENNEVDALEVTSDFVSLLPIIMFDYDLTPERTWIEWGKGLMSSKPKDMSTILDQTSQTLELMENEESVEFAYPPGFRILEKTDDGKDPVDGIAMKQWIGNYLTSLREQVKLISDRDSKANPTAGIWTSRIKMLTNLTAAITDLHKDSLALAKDHYAIYYMYGLVDSCVNDMQHVMKKKEDVKQSIYDLKFTIANDEIRSHLGIKNESSLPVLDADSPNVLQNFEEFAAITRLQSLNTAYINATAYVDLQKGKLDKDKFTDAIFEYVTESSAEKIWNYVGPAPKTYNLDTQAADVLKKNMKVEKDIYSFVDRIEKIKEKIQLIYGELWKTAKQDPKVPHREAILDTIFVNIDLHKPMRFGDFEDGVVVNDSTTKLTTMEKQSIALFNAFRQIAKEIYLNISPDDLLDCNAVNSANEVRKYFKEFIDKSAEIDKYGNRVPYMKIATDDFSERHEKWLTPINIRLNETCKKTEAAEKPVNGVSAATDPASPAAASAAATDPASPAAASAAATDPASGDGAAGHITITVANSNSLMTEHRGGSSPSGNLDLEVESAQKLWIIFQTLILFTHYASKQIAYYENNIKLYRGDVKALMNAPDANGIKVTDAPSKKRLFDEYTTTNSQWDMDSYMHMLRKHISDITFELLNRIANLSKDLNKWKQSLDVPKKEENEKFINDLNEKRNRILNHIDVVQQTITAMKNILNDLNAKDVSSRSDSDELRGWLTKAAIPELEFYNSMVTTIANVRQQKYIYKLNEKLKKFNKEIKVQVPVLDEILRYITSSGVVLKENPRPKGIPEIPKDNLTKDQKKSLYQSAKEYQDEVMEKFANAKPPEEVSSIEPYMKPIFMVLIYVFLIILFYSMLHKMKTNTSYKANLYQSNTENMPMQISLLIARLKDLQALKQGQIQIEDPALYFEKHMLTANGYKYDPVSDRYIDANSNSYTLDDALDAYMTLLAYVTDAKDTKYITEGRKQKRLVKSVSMSYEAVLALLVDQYLTTMDPAKLNGIALNNNQIVGLLQSAGMMYDSKNMCWRWGRNGTIGTTSVNIGCIVGSSAQSDLSATGILPKPSLIQTTTQYAVEKMLTTLNYTSLATNQDILNSLLTDAGYVVTGSSNNYTYSGGNINLGQTISQTTTANQGITNPTWAALDLLSKSSPINGASLNKEDLLMTYVANSAGRSNYNGYNSSLSDLGLVTGSDNWNILMGSNSSPTKLTTQQAASYYYLLSLPGRAFDTNKYGSSLTALNYYVMTAVNTMISAFSGYTIPSGTTTQSFSNAYLASSSGGSSTPVTIMNFIAAKPVALEYGMVYYINTQLQVSNIPSTVSPESSITQPQPNSLFANYYINSVKPIGYSFKDNQTTPSTLQTFSPSDTIWHDSTNTTTLTYTLGQAIKLIVPANMQNNIYPNAASPWKFVPRGTSPASVTTPTTVTITDALKTLLDASPSRDNIYLYKNNTDTTNTPILQKALLSYYYHVISKSIEKPLTDPEINSILSSGGYSYDSSSKKYKNAGWTSSSGPSARDDAMTNLLATNHYTLNSQAKLFRLTSTYSNDVQAYLSLFPDTVPSAGDALNTLKESIKSGQSTLAADTSLNNLYIKDGGAATNLNLFPDLLGEDLALSIISSSQIYKTLGYTQDSGKWYDLQKNPITFEQIQKTANFDVVKKQLYDQMITTMKSYQACHLLKVTSVTVPFPWSEFIVNLTVLLVCISALAFVYYNFNPYQLATNIAECQECIKDLKSYNGPPNQNPFAAKCAEHSTLGKHSLSMEMVKISFLLAAVVITFYMSSIILESTFTYGDALFALQSNGDTAPCVD